MAHKRHLVVIPDVNGAPEVHRMKPWVRQNPQALPAGFDPAGKQSRQMRAALRRRGWAMLEDEHEVRLFPPGTEPADPGPATAHGPAERAPARADRTLTGERAWVHGLVPRLQAALQAAEPALEVRDGYRLAYSREILSYHASEPHAEEGMRYEADLLLVEHAGAEWTPRVVMEAKLERVTTHDAITYSQKAATHKQVHPYLRYGIILGARGHDPLPGRLFRHGAHFDFMLSWAAREPADDELGAFIQLLLDEVRASRLLQEIMYNTRTRNRKGYRILHRPLLARERLRGDGA